MRRNMKIFFRRFVAAAGVVILSLLLFSCQTDKAPGTSSVTTTEARKESLVVVSDKKTDYKFVRQASASYVENKLFNEFRADIASKTGIAPGFVSDSEDATEYEILLGRTSRTLSQDAYSKLGDNRFSITAENKTIAISASDSGCMKLALEKFTELFVKDGNLIVDSSLLPITFECKDEITTVKFDNTKTERADDPYIVEHEGSYYYCWSDGEIKVARLDSLERVTRSNGKRVFSSAGKYTGIWAPELHYIDGEWYIYVAMVEGNGGNEVHRMYCLKGTSQDPTGRFTLVGQVTDKTDKWAIDGTVFKYNNELYTVWSGWEGDTNVSQNIYIAHMSNPWTIDSERVLLSKPDYWDNYTRNPAINEGPCVAEVDGKIFILFSGNGSWTDDYSIGYLEFDGSDPLDASSWTKSKRPILQKGEKTYGPGHCSVFKAVDGSLWMAYHANLKSGTGWNGRSFRMQPLEIKNGKPGLMKPQLEVDLPMSKKILVGEVK